MSRTVIISAGGEATRWNNYLDTPKHMVQVDGMPILTRTVFQVENHEPEGIHIVSKEDLIPGVKSYQPKNSPDYTEANKIYSSKDLWSKDGRTILLFGDTYFTNEAIDTIMAHPEPGFWAFGRAFGSNITGKEYGEIYAISFYPENIPEIEFALNRATELEKRGVIEKANIWSLYRAILKIPDDLMGRHIVSDKHFVQIDDWTEDFDYPHDYDRFMENR